MPPFWLWQCCCQLHLRHLCSQKTWHHHWMKLQPPEWLGHLMTHWSPVEREIWSHQSAVVPTIILVILQGGTRLVVSLEQYWTQWITKWLLGSKKVKTQTGQLAVFLASHKQSEFKIKKINPIIKSPWSVLKIKPLSCDVTLLLNVFSAVRGSATRQQ